MTNSVTMTQPHADALMKHLFPGDGDEHAAALLAGRVQTPSGTRFLVRDVVLAKDGIDFVPGTRSYRSTKAEFVARVSDRCVREELCYFPVHSHGGCESVAFSQDDLASHRRGFPALLDITKSPVGALVFAQNAVAGQIWSKAGVSKLDEMTVIGPNIRHLYPSPQPAPVSMGDVYHRQSLLFGIRGQHALARAKVAVIGLGGVGALVSEWLAHLGVGWIVGVDFDRLEPSNRPRVVGATPWDAGQPFVDSRFHLVRRFGKWLSRYKVHIAKRTAERANPAIRYDAVIASILHDETARQLRDCDYIFLCADGIWPRLVFNALVHQFLIPGVQIGSKILVDEKTGIVGDVTAAARRVLPYSGGGCLCCNQLIPPRGLQEESLKDEVRHAQRYVDDLHVTVPSVITLNARAASQAVDDFLFGFQGLLLDNAASGYHVHSSRERKWLSVAVRGKSDCLHCGPSLKSSFARGDNWDLPSKSS